MVAATSVPGKRVELPADRMSGERDAYAHPSTLHRNDRWKD